ncbi:unnamed protein product, partial [Symbiodinium sp. KB8]
MKFMEPLAQELMNCIAAKAPVQNSDASEELAKAKAKLAQHGIEVSPLKRKQESEPGSSDQQGKRAKPPMPIVDVEPKPPTDVQKLLAEPKRKLDSRPKGATDDHVTDWLNTFKTKPEFKGKHTKLVKYVKIVQDLLKTGTAKDEIVSAAVRFGLDAKLVSRLPLKNLSATIAVAQFEAKGLRSDRYLPDEIYSLIRLSNCLEEPGKSKARKLTWKDVSVARSLLHKHFVVHCEDHGPDVFEPVEGSQEQLTTWVLDRIPGHGASNHAPAVEELAQQILDSLSALIDSI